MRGKLALVVPWAVLFTGLTAAESRLFFSKSFPGSVPAYVGIAVEPSGAAEYKESADDDNPLKFEMDSSAVSDMFALADKLDRFKRPLESPLKVAKMGMKTFRFEEGGKKSEVQFNFSEDPDARALADWFERISETAQHYYVLERSVKYDKLGVDKALLQFETALEKKRVVAPPLFLPMLDRVAKNDSYLNMARTRAAGLAEAIRSAK